MLEEDNFSWFLTLWLSLILYNFIVFGELYLIGLDHLGDFRFLWLFEAGKHLYQIDGNSKDVFRCCDDLFVFFCVIFELSIKVYFSAIDGIL